MDYLLIHYFRCVGKTNAKRQNGTVELFRSNCMYIKHCHRIGVLQKILGQSTLEKNFHIR